ncbi:MAG TPA: type II secretion system F family protein [Phycisphaerae bacterium]|nr:type II secretion system F family protein [Phycisphaerae bacterium]
MATYQYLARTSGGDEVTGLIQAETEAAAVRALDERQLFPVRVMSHERTEKGFRSGRVRARDLSVLYGQLSDLLGADVPALRALEILSRSTINRRLAGHVNRIREDVAAGKSLAEAMTAFPGVFKTLHVAMVRAGERAGFLETVLANLSQFLDRQDELRNKVRGALVYPLLVLTVGMTVGIIVLVAIVPQFRDLFEDIPVPWTTRVLFAISGSFQMVWPLLLLGGVVAVVGVWSFMVSERGQRLWDGWRLRIPVIGGVTRLVAITRFCRILGMMLANGVPLLESLAISKDATGSMALADSIAQATENVRAGATLAEPLRSSGFFPAEILEMIAVAEESNQMEKTLQQIADTVERRTSRQVDLGVRLIEPLILVALAGGIAVFAAALIYPIFSMAGSIGR